MQLTEEQVMDRLRAAIAEAGSQKSFAAQHGLSLPYVNDVLRGRRAFADRILDALGIEKVIVFFEIGTRFSPNSDDTRPLSRPDDPPTAS